MKKTVGIIAAVLLYTLSSCSGPFIDPGVLEITVNSNGIDEYMGHYIKVDITKNDSIFVISTLSYPFFQPSVPKDVPDDIYSKLWAIHLKTIKAGKYDYIALNSNTTHWIVFDESALSDDFTFEGVCANYADYFVFVLKHDEQLLELYNTGVISSISGTPAADHAWIEYYTENNKYIIDPTWSDWDFVGTPKGQFAGNIEFAEACRGPDGHKLIEAKSKEWFFRNVKTVTKDNDKVHHDL